jgi:acetyl-CoA carboxylase carboxyltransferase component
MLSYMPQNCEDTSPRQPHVLGDEYRDLLGTIIPESASTPYDMRDVIKGICDEDSFFEIHRNYADNIVVGFARLAGRSIGIVANQPMSLAGVLDIERARVSPVSATASTSRCWCWWMYQASCPGPTRNGMGSSPTVPNCCTL